MKNLSSQLTHCQLTSCWDIKEVSRGVELWWIKVHLWPLESIILSIFCPIVSTLSSVPSGSLYVHFVQYKNDIYLNLSTRKFFTCSVGSHCCHLLQSYPFSYKLIPSTPTTNCSCFFYFRTQTTIPFEQKYTLKFNCINIFSIVC